MALRWTVLPAPAPMGALTVGVTEVGLVLVVFGDEPAVAERAAVRLCEPLEAGGGSAAEQQLREYLAGERRVFDMPLDWSLTAGSQRRVLEALFDTVAFGATVTYGELAARSGLGHAHTAARGVGSIMGSNPIPVVVPCHRVARRRRAGRLRWRPGHEGMAARAGGGAHSGPRLRAGVNPSDYRAC